MRGILAALRCALPQRDDAAATKVFKLLYRTDKAEGKKVRMHRRPGMVLLE